MCLAFEGTESLGTKWRVSFSLLIFVVLLISYNSLFSDYYLIEIDMRSVNPRIIIYFF